jgi:protein-L-isoaspartate(D-aspartate) O-methyltransferase
MSDDFELIRKQMIDQQLRRRNITSAELLQAFEKVPRHLFVPENNRHLAYADKPLPIGNSQTISQPYMVAIMTQLLQLKPTDKVLEIGTGCGYQTAILAELADYVFSLERIPALAKQARQNLELTEITNVEVLSADGTLGLATAAPFDKIIVTAAAPKLPPNLADQLANGGRMVIPIGTRLMQDIIIFTKENDQISKKKNVACRFVPLIGEDGWQE